MKIEVINVAKTFQEFSEKTTVFSNINVTFHSGKIYGLVGINGSGKSVLLKIICGFYEPSSGHVLFDGIDCYENRSFPPNTRALIEKPGFLPELTGLENLELLASIQKKITRNQIIETLKKVHLEQEMNKKFRKYSLGMKQKLGIAQVLMEDPQVMIFDEPFNGIEIETANEIRDLLKVEKERGKLIVIASHIPTDMEQLADEVYEMKDGMLEKISQSKSKNKGSNHAKQKN